MCSRDLRDKRQPLCALVFVRCQSVVLSFYTPLPFTAFPVCFIASMFACSLYFFAATWTRIDRIGTEFRVQKCHSLKSVQMPALRFVFPFSVVPANFILHFFLVLRSAVFVSFSPFIFMYPLSGAGLVPCMLRRV